MDNEYKQRLEEMEENGELSSTDKALLDKLRANEETDIRSNAPNFDAPDNDMDEDTLADFVSGKASFKPSKEAPKPQPKSAPIPDSLSAEQNPQDIKTENFPKSAPEKKTIEGPKEGASSSMYQPGDKSKFPDGSIHEWTGKGDPNNPKDLANWSPSQESSAPEKKEPAKEKAPSIGIQKEKVPDEMTGDQIKARDTERINILAKMGSENLSDEQKEPFNTQIQNAKNMIAQSEELFAKREERTNWLQAADIIGQALTKLAAGYYGMRTGYDLSGIPFNPHNWDKEMDRIYDRYDKDVGRYLKYQEKAEGQLAEAEKSHAHNVTSLKKEQMETWQKQDEGSRRNREDILNRNAAANRTEASVNATLQGIMLRNNNKEEADKDKAVAQTLKEHIKSLNTAKAAADKEKSTSKQEKAYEDILRTQPGYDDAKIKEVKERSTWMPGFLGGVSTKDALRAEVTTLQNLLNNNRFVNKQDQ